ncbi:MAG: hypothetical protein N2115_04955, partial [bacterium]|nr:hypothetical protein [bacterium]
TDKIERIGVARAIEWIEKAEIVLVLLDNSSEIDQMDLRIIEMAKNKPHIIILNKCDLASRIDKDKISEINKVSDIIKISCITQEGIDQLRSEIIKKINEGFCEIRNPEFFLNLRQINLLQKTLKILEETESLLNGKANYDIVAEMLRFTLTQLDEISGKNLSEEILDEIFSRFCIGK